MEIEIENLVLVQIDARETLCKSITNWEKSPKARITQLYIKSRLENLETLFGDFKAVHKEIVAGVSVKDKQEMAYFKSDLYQDVEEKYFIYKVSLQEKLESITPAKEVQSSTQVSLPSAAHNEIPLPRINLPTFSGKYSEWQTFHDLFLSLVHNNSSITGVRKLQHLKSCLTGEPEILLRNLTTTEVNYEEAWNQLKRRYDNKRYNCNAVMKTLFGQKQITSESATAIKSLLDTTTSCLKALNNLGIDVESWDTIIIHLVVSKLDVESHKQWEIKISELSPESLPKWSQFTNFLESRFRSLEMIDTSRTYPKPSYQSVSTHKPVIRPKSFLVSSQNQAAVESTAKDPCIICSGQHYLYQCKEFAQKSPQERQEYVQKSRLCFNCLAQSHPVKFCRLVNSCRRCGRRHHSMLHIQSDRDANHQRTTNQQTSYQSHAGTVEVNHDHETDDQEESIEHKIISTFSENDRPCNVLLATAKIKVNNLVLRALLDQGSQASFVTEEAVQLLNLQKISINGSVSGIGEGSTRIKHRVNLHVESCYNRKISLKVNAYVLSSLTSFLPTKELSKNKSLDWVDLEHLPLADPDFSKPGKIDVLLGAEVYGEILQNGIIKNHQNNLVAQNTVLGWIISGKVCESENLPNERIINFHLQFREDHFLKRFWEIEAEPDSIKKKITKEQQMCEDIYEKTTSRDEEGRFVVKLPLISEDPECQYGNLREIAKRRYKFLENKLSKKPQLELEYHQVLKEYVTLNHMRKISDQYELNDSRAVYLPHHAVVREDKDTTKLRVVFDASCKGVNHVSLNDDLLVGPKLQQDLRHIIMRWRNHKICLVADLIKMYRQVRVYEQDTRFQRILWRSDPNGPIEHYALLTLTFGTACAPYLAVKSIQKLAEDVETQYPVAAKITKEDYYIDDLMTGCETVTEGIRIYEEMNALMGSGGFTLQKWSSNNIELLKYIHRDKQNQEKTVPIKIDNLVKVLGISWDRENDKFVFKLNLPEFKEPVTKRKVLSDIARLYDAMGWVAPVIVTAKIFIQKLWKASLSWDDHLPSGLREEWLSYRNNLVYIDNLSIPRWVHYQRGCNVELHAFADASKSAYAAVLYIRILDHEHDKAIVSLHTSKTKVAPIEKELSIPRLELCAAELAAKLLYESSQVLQIPQDKLFAWTDSTVVLAWLRGLPCRWTTFVCNRVSKILDIMNCEQWRHISTTLNPADCASRGLQPQEMKDHRLWWSGPPFLENKVFDCPLLEYNTTEEERPAKTLTIIHQTENDIQIINRFSNLSRMLRVLSYCRRWLRVKQKREEKKSFNKEITIQELEDILILCIKRIQESEFTEELKNLKLQKPVPKKSVLHTLHPFVDNKGIVRVGGRIDQAKLCYDTRHPIIIPAKTQFTKLIIAQAHEVTLHGGPQMMLNFIRAKYWIIGARYQVKNYYRNCITCLRYSKAGAVQLMGQIPEKRLKPTKPFKTAGVDFAGPIQLRFSPGRGSKSYKGYICLFICLVTRAIHLEAVSDLTSKGFMAAFRRFVARRGHCKDLYSDNGTNFVGAEKLLKEMFDSAKSNLPDEIKQSLTLEGTTWHFIPPHAPNFGGSWEAGVRSTKHHLRRVIGESTLTFEEMTTVLSQIEACLNSRPLTQISDNPNDPLPLTPGHFLVGEPLINIADTEYTTETGLDRWRVVQKMVTDFWKQWSKEYLVNLNQRYKWTKQVAEPEIGDVVIIREDHLPPAKWLLGKIVDKFYGKDNLARVVNIQCENNILKRPISKIIVFPKPSANLNV